MAGSTLHTGGKKEKSVGNPEWINCIYLILSDKGICETTSEELWARTLTTKLEDLLQSLGKTLLSELKLDLLLGFQDTGKLMTFSREQMEITCIFSI